MDTQIKKRIKKYIQNNSFFEEDEFDQLVLNYLDIDFIKISSLYLLIRNIYRNLDKDDIILEKAKKIYKLGGLKYLQCSLYILYEALAKTKNYNILTYPRKLEFLYQDITPDWQA